MPDRAGTVLAVSAGMALAFVGGGAGVATAQQEGVFVDPDSPAGKEYALPLDTARREAQGGGGSPAAGADAPALFGEGISPRSSAQRDGAGPGKSGSTNGTSSGERDRSGAAEASQAVAKAVAQRSGGLSAGWLTILIAAGVLLAGITIGVSVRVLRGPNQTP